jgi:hypothetical protein
MNLVKYDMKTTTEKGTLLGKRSQTEEDEQE